MISTRAMGRDGATLRVQGWDGSSLGAETLGGADPLGFAAGDANLYRYVGNDPIDDVDPTGFQKALGMAQPKPIYPTESTIIGISTGVISTLKSGGGPNGLVTLPEGGKTAAGAPNTYQGPCAVFASALTTALTNAGIKYTIHFYQVAAFATTDPTVEYTSPIPPCGGPPYTRKVKVKATVHVIIEVQTASGPIFLDAGVGRDPLNNSNGNFGNATTGVIAPENQNPVITSSPGQNPKVVNKPLLKPKYP